MLSGCTRSVSWRSGSPSPSIGRGGSSAPTGASAGGWGIGLSGSWAAARSSARSETGSRTESRRSATRVGGVIERYRDGSAFEAVASYCRAVRSGPAIAVSGTAAMGPEGRALHPGDTYAQTKAAFERAVEAAGELGADPEHVVRTRIYLGPGSDWRDAVRAHHYVFEGIDPANTTLYVAGFIPEGALVEVEVDAWVPA